MNKLPVHLIQTLHTSRQLLISDQKREFNDRIEERVVIFFLAYLDKELSNDYSDHILNQKSFVRVSCAYIY